MEPLDDVRRKTQGANGQVTHDRVSLPDRSEEDRSGEEPRAGMRSAPGVGDGRPSLYAGGRHARDKACEHRPSAAMQMVVPVVSMMTPSGGSAAAIGA